MDNKPLKLGSLFDGSGGFPLAATHVGIEPVWASEIEPFPILVTTARFPNVKHLGDVARINGAEVEPVDIITFGSPCQDLSVAGKRAGLAGARSSLFFHAVRIIKEMRKATHGAYPRFAVWENVPGAFSSNKGADFHSVLQNLVSVVDEAAAADLPRASRWEPAGLLVGDGWSIAWRVLDAQYFGLAQRRKRIYLVCDFGSERAGQLLFEPQRVCGDSAPGGSEEQDPPTNPRESTHEASTSLDVFALRMRAGKPGGGKGPLVQTNLSGTLGCGNDQTIFAPEPTAFGFNALHEGRGAGVGRYGYPTKVSKTLDTSGIAPTCNQGGIAIVEPDVVSASKADFFCRGNVNVAGALLASDATEPPLVTDPSVPEYRVRRLTPTECARLQGFPDDWTDGLAITNPGDEQVDYWWRIWAHWAVINNLKKTKTRLQVRKWLADPVTDRALYKLWGNGIALPCAQFVLERIAACARGAEL